MTNPPRVTIVYSWDDEPHKRWVKAFATRLRDDGVDVTLDQWDAPVGARLPEFMEKAVRDSDFVVLICTEGYKQRFDGRRRGVGYEGHIIAAEVLRENTNRFIPALRSGSWSTSVPTTLEGVHGVDLSGDPYNEEAYRLLAKRLHGLEERKPAIGGLPPWMQSSEATTQTRGAQPIARGCDPGDLEIRCGELLEKLFARTLDARERRLHFDEAFQVLRPNLCLEMVFTGSVKEFSRHAAAKVFEHGYAGKGQHCLSLLLGAIEKSKGLQMDPEFYALKREVDSLYRVPAPKEVDAYLSEFCQTVAKKARPYFSLEGNAQVWTKHENSEIPELYPEGFMEYQAEKRSDEVQPQGRAFHDVLDAVDTVPQAVLLGAPGSGKSTTLAKLALERASRAKGQPATPIPILADLAKWKGTEDIAAFLKSQIVEIGWAVEELAGRGRLLVLLDGLNEMPGDRVEKLKSLREFRQGLDARTVFLVACREADYTGDLNLKLDRLTLKPLTPDRILQMVERWMQVYRKPVELAGQFFCSLAGDSRLRELLEKWVSAGREAEMFWTASELKNGWEVLGFDGYRLWHEHVPNERSLMRLAANPFQLLMLFHYWSKEKRFPKNRSGLFDWFCQSLLNQELVREQGETAKDPEAKGWREKEIERLLARLDHMAWQMQRTGIESRRVVDFGVLIDAPRAEALRLLGEDGVRRVLGAKVLEGEGEVRFGHQLLQEYFAARMLRMRMGTMQAKELWPRERWWKRTGWEETAVLLAGFHGEDCGALIRWLAEAQPETAAQCVLESGAGIAGKDRLMSELRAAWMPRLTDEVGEPAPEGRAAIGRALGRLKLDDRPGVRVKNGVPDIEWVKIEGGEFVYQEGRRPIDTFWMARYPVTNAQWEAFLKAEDGYENDRWWKGMTEPDRKQSEGWWKEENRPRENVNWWEAVAFSRWLGCALKDRGLLPDPKGEVRLPTEWEWERAARGRNGWEYPWGDGYVVGKANIDETETGVGPHYLQGTSAVGMYEGGASEEGVMDLSGNVWEWCLNEWKEPERVQVGGTGSRVLRGGSWVSDQENARAVRRIGELPNNRDVNIGFRVVCSAPIAGH